ncbi:MAG: hypothetical protein HQM00_05815 [Magnetococcales bacterium]|nr:hypothetical protein [Magnetococcales bacterium]
MVDFSRILLLLLLLSPGVRSAFGDDAPSQESRPQAVAVEQLLVRIQQDYSGCRILKLELEVENDSWIYEVKLLRRDGVVLKRKYRAEDLTLLKEHSQHKRP